MAITAITLAIAPIGRASPIEIDLNYANTSKSSIQFDGKSHFTFTPTHNDFDIIAGGSAAGLLGDLSGTFTIGAVTTVGKVSSAPVTGTGSFVIHDGFGFDLVASVSWLNIVQVGSGDGLNTTGAVNVTGISYSGANSTLLLLAKTPSTASDALAFQFLPAKTLSALKTSKSSTSFNGTIYAERVPDTGTAMALVGIGLLGLGVLSRRFAVC